MSDEATVTLEPALEEIFKQLDGLTLGQAANLVKALEERWDVSAAAPAAVAMAAPTDAGEAAEEKTEFDVVLKSSGSSKIAVIKAVREITGLGLKEAKSLVEEAPKAVKEAVAKEEAEELKKKLTEAGAEVELK